MSRSLKFFAVDRELTLLAGVRFAGARSATRPNIVVRGLGGCNALQCAGTVRVLAGLKVDVKFEGESFTLPVKRKGAEDAKAQQMTAYAEASARLASLGGVA